MAGDAGGRRAGKLPIGMAFRACQACVRAGEGEAGERVVEGGRFPGARAVASSTIGSELATVRVILGVAGTAGRGRTRKLTVRMAALASHALVRASKREPGG